MPQIWPMNWIVLFILFTLTFATYLSSIYFFYPNYDFSHQEGGLSCPPQNLEWKW